MWKKDRNSQLNNILVQPRIFCPHYTTIRDISLWKTLYLIFSVYTILYNKALYHFQFFSVYFSFRTELDPWILRFRFCSADTESTWILLHKCKYVRNIIYFNWMEPISKLYSWLMKNSISIIIATTSHYESCEGLRSLDAKVGVKDLA